MLDDAPVLVSAVNHYLYCPRRCALIHLEHNFEENIHTQKGRREHETVDDVTHDIVAGARIERAIPIWSERLGLSGKSDVVEIRPDGIIYPVEYKHGARHRWVNDDAQLCAQALCLEEMFGRAIAGGAIFHIKSRRRREVSFDAALRATVEAAVASIRDMLIAKHIPAPVRHPRCEECSLKMVCVPEIRGGERRWIFEPLGSQ